MFAAVDAHGSLTEPFSISWSSTSLLPRQWYTVSTESTNLQISRGSPGLYGMILLLAGSNDEPESKPLTH